MKGIVIYLFACLAGLIALTAGLINGSFAGWITEYQLPIACALFGGIGGILYCMRGVYLNYCVKNKWLERWHVWYVIRPFMSLVTGCISYFFLKAGLLVLEAQSSNNSSHFGFYALAFIAGLNVDKFIEKLEEIAEATWGIKKSRASKDLGEEIKPETADDAKLPEGNK